MVCCRVARFFSVQNTKTGKNKTNDHKLYQMSKNISKDREMDLVSLKYAIIFHCKTLQNLPILKFWFENKPSGNPGLLLNHPSFTVKLVTEVNHGSLFKQDAESFFSDPDPGQFQDFVNIFYKKGSIDSQYIAIYAQK
jgi:hypothetical protein